MNYFPKEKEFQRYAKSEFNISGSQLDQSVQQLGMYSK